LAGSPSLHNLDRHEDDVALPAPREPCASGADGVAGEGAVEFAQAECLDGRMAGLSGVMPALGAVPAASEYLSDYFSAVVERYQGSLISFLYGMVANREQAEDLAQEALIKAYEGMQHRRPGQLFTSGWLFRIARNTAIDALRRRNRITWLPFGLEHEAVAHTRPDFSGQLADRELVQEVLARMPARYRECLMLRSVAGLSNGEIAKAMGISVRNANTTLFRARERFRDLFEQLGGTDPGSDGDGATPVPMKGHAQ